MGNKVVITDAPPTTELSQDLPSAPPATPTELSQCLPSEDSDEIALKQEIERCCRKMVREVVKAGKLDKLEILTRELDYYLNELIAIRKCKTRAQIKELMEEKMRSILN